MYIRVQLLKGLQRVTLRAQRDDSDDLDYNNSHMYAWTDALLLLDVYTTIRSYSLACFTNGPSPWPFSLSPCLKPNLHIVVETLGHLSSIQGCRYVWSVGEEDGRGKRSSQVCLSEIRQTWLILFVANSRDH